MKLLKNLTMLCVALALATLCVIAFPTKAQAATYGDLTYEITDGEVTITECNTSASGSIVIPAIIDGYPVTSIGTYSFSGCSNLTSVEISDGVISIGAYAFYECDGLESVVMPDSIISVDNMAFKDCKIKKLIIADGAEAVTSSMVVCRSTLQEVHLPESVISIGDNAFRACLSLNSIMIPNSVVNIGIYAFSRCENLTSIEIPNSVTGIGHSAFLGCSRLSSISLPENITRIEESMFYWCDALTSIVIPESVTHIDRNAFCLSGLTSVIIPKNVTSIGTEAFDRCWNLTGIWVDKENAKFSSDRRGVLFNKEKTTLIVAPTAISGNYIIPDSVTYIEDFAFHCSNLTGIAIPEGNISLGRYTFSGCINLKTIVIPQSMTYIDGYAFQSCYALSDVAYCGDANQWESVKYVMDNEWLCGATIHYESKFEYIDNCENKGVYCDGCNEYIIEEFDAHSYIKTVNHPTLAVNGYTMFTCEKCGHSYTEEYTFPDVPKSLWSYNAIEFAIAKGYFNGYENGKFGPADMITRQDFVVVLARIAKVDLKKFSGRTSFPDVKAGSYYEPAVKWATTNGIVNGYNTGKFGVNDKITREQLVTILYNYAKKMGYNVSVPASSAAKLKNYTDAYKITGYAKPAVIWALHKGIINGMTATTIGPQNTASRAQVATILMNISKKGIMNI